VRIGIVQVFDGTPGRDRRHIEGYARTVERLGFDSLWVPDHVVFFDDYDSPYPHTDDGTIDFKQDQGIYEPAMALLAAAGVTERIRLGTSVEILTVRNPVTRAKEIATLDVLSGGRVEYGVGIGWSREEYAAIGVPFENRGPRMDEYIDAMRAQWTQSRATFQGRFAEFDRIVAFPKPAQGSVPFMIGGNSRPALRRVARKGDGWHGWKLSLPELERTLETLAEELEAADRPRSEVKLNVGLPFNGGSEELREYADGCRALGIDELVLALPISRHRFEEQLADYAEAIEVRPAASGV
jgi:probable F420-dependent oxidoreductase